MFFIICAAILLPCNVLSFPNTVSELSRKERSYEKDVIGHNNSADPILQKMHVDSYIRNRYARTIIHTKYMNPKNEPQEVDFSVVLPEEAFITEFIMEVKGKEYKGYVREKDAAKREYAAAVISGLGAAHVAASLRDSNEFTVSINVQALSTVTFNLTYEHLLQKKMGMNEMILHLHPEQIVEDFSVKVHINETRPIINIQIPEIQNEKEIFDKFTNNEYVTISDLNPEGTEKQIIFTPTTEQQTNTENYLETNEIQKFTGRFIVRYEVDQNPGDGELITSDGYFVHFFSPNDLEPMPKNVIFVLDISGSMVGQKIKQLRDAMKIILGECNENDYFSVVTFQSDVEVLKDAKYWQTITNPKESYLPKPIPANEDNIFNAQNTISQLTEKGLTNINDALVVALRLANMKNINTIQHTTLKPIIIFLTDGEPNVGEQNPNKLIDLVKSLDSAQTAIFTIAIGKDAKEEFLKDLANANFGFMRKIYEASDIALQLNWFYNQISSPLLSNVNFKYDENEITNVTKTYTHQIFKGSDLVIAGKIKSLIQKNLTVEGLTKTGPRTYRLKIKPLKYKSETKKYGSMERLWAYLTIQKLLKNTKFSDTKKEALDLALKYSFVTPITSLVVVKPNGTEEIDLKKINVVKDKKVSNYGQIFSKPKVQRNFLQVSTTSAPRRSNTFGMPMLTSFSYFQIHHDVVTPAPKENDIDKLVRLVPWLGQYVRDEDSVLINNTIYFFGNEKTSINFQSCHIESENQSGYCELFRDCPSMLHKLSSYETYTNKYMCTLNMGRRIKFLGVCCY